MSELKLELQANMQLTQRTSMSQLTEWELDPLSQMADQHPVFVAMKAGYLDMGEIWKNIRNDLLTSRGMVRVNILGMNGAGKGLLGIALANACLNDQWMHDQARKKGIIIEPRVETFSMSAQVGRIPVSEGGPADLNFPEAEYGNYTDSQYTQLSGFTRRLDLEMASKSKKATRYLYIKERPAPTAYPIERKVMPQVVGTDRAFRSFYSDAYDPKAKAVHVFLMDRDPAVRDQALTDRKLYTSNSSQIENPFTGHMQYLLQSFSGVIRDVATLSPLLQSEVVQLLAMATAPKKAFERSEQEVGAIMENLYKNGQIYSSTETADYLSYLRGLLQVGPYGEVGLDPARVHILRNFELPGVRPMYHLNYLTILNEAVIRYPQLLGSNLRQFVFGK